MDVSLKIQKSSGKTENSTYAKDRKAAKESKRFDVKKVYKSRRTKNFDDNDSNGEDGNSMDTAVITYKDTQGNVTSIKANPKFKPYTNTFKKLVKTTSICTPCIVISCIINFSNEYAVTVMKSNEHQSFVKFYDLKTGETIKEVLIGDGKKEQCIKCNELQ